MSLKEKPAPPPRPEAISEIGVTLHRCPYCHDDVSRVGSVACQGCLARHHDACWEESGCCGSCGDATALRAPTRLTPEVAIDALVQQGFAHAEAAALFATKPARWTASNITRSVIGAMFVAVGVGLFLEILAKLALGLGDIPLFMIGPACLAATMGGAMLWFARPGPDDASTDAR